MLPFFFYPSPGSGEEPIIPATAILTEAGLELKSEAGLDLLTE